MAYAFDVFVCIYATYKHVTQSLKSIWYCCALRRRRHRRRRIEIDTHAYKYFFSFRLVCIVAGRRE